MAAILALAVSESPGMSTGPEHKKMGQEGSPVSEVYFKDCSVPKSAILGGVPGQGFRAVMKSLNKQRINLASLCTGPAIRMLDEALRHAATRKQSGQPIGEFQLVQAMLADCQVEISAARALILETARHRDRGEVVTMDVSCASIMPRRWPGASRIAWCRYGGSGYCEDIGGSVPRFYRDVRLFRLYEGTSQIHQLNIARHLLRGDR